MLNRAGSVFLSLLIFLFLSLRLSFLGSALFAQNDFNNDSILVGTFWYDSRVFEPDNDHYLFSEGKQGIPYAKNFSEIDPDDTNFKAICDGLMEEARFIFSGMVYGWRFVYSPGDQRRKIRENFRLESIAQISEGSDLLSKISAVYKDKGLVQMRISYRIDERSKNYVHFKQSPSLYFATGSGFSDLGREFIYRYKAIEKSIKNAIHVHQNNRLYDKPERIEGIVFLERPPKIDVLNGKFAAESRVIFQIKRVKMYFIP